MPSQVNALTASYAKGGTDVPLIEQTIGDFFAAMAQRQGARDALVSRHQGLRYSYAQLHMAARQLASALLSQGLVKGDRGKKISVRVTRTATGYATLVLKSAQTRKIR